jgi:hypothetical protein
MALEVCSGNLGDEPLGSLRIGVVERGIGYNAIGSIRVGDVEGCCFILRPLIGSVAYDLDLSRNIFLVVKDFELFSFSSGEVVLDLLQVGNRRMEKIGDFVVDGDLFRGEEKG